LGWLSVGGKHARVSTRGVSAGVGPVRVGTGYGRSSGLSGGDFLLIFVIVIIIGGPVWAVTSAYHALFGPHVRGGRQPQTRVIGHLRDMGFWVSFDHIRVPRVWCQWNGSHVQMHLTMMDKGKAKTVTVTPHYKIGTNDHGDSVNSYRDVRLRRGRNSVLLDAGDPSGVDGQPPISECSPDLD
jgi:hypothetical protein